MKKTEALAVQEEVVTAIAAPDFLNDVNPHEGLENAPASRRPLRIVLSQSTTPQTKRANEEEYIDGLEEGMLFNNTERTIYETPVKFVLINVLPPRWIEFFDPKVDGKSGVKDFNVPPGDLRREFRDDGKGGRLKPLATEFRDMLLWLVDTKEILVLALKGTQIKKAEKLVELIKSAGKSGHGQVFLVEPVADKKNDYSFYNVKFSRAPEKWTSPDVFAAVRSAYQSYKDVQVNITVDVAASDDDVIDSTPIADTDIPF